MVREFLQASCHLPAIQKLEEDLSVRLVIRDHPRSR